MSPTATKEGDANDEEVKVVKAEKRKKAEISKKEESGSKVAKQEPVNIYQTILEMERKESEERAASADHGLWKETCGEVRSLMKDIFELKMKKGSAADIAEKRIQASLLFVTLKKLNRLEKLRIKRSRDATYQSKQGVDSFNLQLQNLLYEVLHLKKEVTKCVHFKSADESLDLIPESQFFKEAPSDIAKPEVTKTDPHALKLARLQWELARRKELSEDAERKEGDRDGLELSIRQREDRLRELQPQLQAILLTTQPVQEYLSLPLDYQREQTKLARLLPTPLYICYTQVCAYAEACDPLVEATVRGDGDEARKWREEREKKQNNTEEEEDVEVIEQESIEEDGGEKKSRGKSSTKVEDKKEAVLAFHPLSVALVVKAEGCPDSSLLVTLHYLPSLGIVTVRTSLGGEAKMTGEAVDPSTMLSQLYPDDTGLTLPSPVHYYTLREAGLQAESLAQLLPGHLAYIWAQKLCGLDLLPSEPQSPAPTPSSNTSRSVVKQTLESLRDRLLARLDLAKQLITLAKCKSTDHLLPFSLAGQYPARVISRLKVWTPTDWEAFSQVSFTKHMIQHGVVDHNDFLFKATCMRDKATLVAYVAIKPNYPVSAPIFCLSLSGLAGKPPDAAPRPPGSPRLQGESLQSSEWVRDFEMEMNLHWSDQLPLSAPTCTGLLTAQLHRLLVMMDVVLEACTDTEKGVCFPKSQVFFSAMRGKMRRLPLQFCNNTQVFQQR